MQLAGVPDDRAADRRSPRTGPGATGPSRRRARSADAPAAASYRPRGRTASAQSAGRPPPHQPRGSRSPASTIATCHGWSGSDPPTRGQLVVGRPPSTPAARRGGTASRPTGEDQTELEQRDVARARGRGCGAASRAVGGSSVVRRSGSSSESGLRSRAVRRRGSSSGRPSASSADCRRTGRPAPRRTRPRPAPGRSRGGGAARRSARGRAARSAARRGSCRSRPAGRPPRPGRPGRSGRAASDGGVTSSRSPSGVTRSADRVEQLDHPPAGSSRTPATRPGSAAGIAIGRRRRPGVEVDPAADRRRAAVLGEQLRRARQRGRGHLAGRRRARTAWPPRSAAGAGGRCARPRWAPSAPPRAARRSSARADLGRRAAHDGGQPDRAGVVGDQQVVRGQRARRRRPGWSAARRPRPGAR